MNKVAVISFPGTNCDLDTVSAIKELTSLDAEIVWHKDFKGKKYDAIIIPGGFSYGDWLRAGAIAARSKAMEEVVEEAINGKPVLGICNGFQILVESSLLPGVLLPNELGRFICRWTRVSIENPKGPWLKLANKKEKIDMPIAHAEGRFYIDSEKFKAISNSSPIIYYENGWNPNGSFYDIAGIGNEEGNVLGLMPHPERAYTEILSPRGFHGNGGLFFKSLEDSLKRGW
ncbi:phosphoribosylformylglycinamidine synthase subunit PurQ [Fervidicoccus fontis]|uniref:phosphoribosylformylglycinamidine synthase subunit PurQ n=1 Tax=Fervidicoccus fontis TaxID=683846 RepID=UPI000AB55F9F|nr:phosphoribosylformylglycinamidine synthase subunit PurQ [Fervidicoccus fontis]